MLFEKLVPYIQEKLNQHHSCYIQQCKGTLWEENCAYALNQTGYTTDWQPNFNHGSGKDQTIKNTGIAISNKTGVYSAELRLIKDLSGSRLQKYATLQEKLEYLDQPHQDYIFLLSVDPKEWSHKNPKYRFIVLDSHRIRFSDAQWTEKIDKNGKLTGWKCSTEYYDAHIKRSLSDQLWLKNIKSSLFDFNVEIQCYC
jgi:hypothetical protein